MPRKPKDYKFLSVKLDRHISDRFETYCDIEGRTKTTALERILKAYLDEYDSKNNNATGKGANENRY